MTLLGSHATPASIKRYQFAQEIAAACPITLFDEIALTGSSARGIATDESDIEMNFWVQELPSLEARQAWVLSLGVTDIVAHTEPRPDESYWVNGIYKSIELEAGWQTFSALDQALTELIEARTTNHKALRLAELVLSAKPLRGNGALEKWQPILQNYPDDLAQALIIEALTDWLSPNWLTSHPTENPFKSDIHRVWRLIFALNHQWEINWKYAHHSLKSLDIYPNNITDRIREIQSSPMPRATQQMLMLIRDTLELISSNYPSQLASDNINQSNLLLNKMSS